LRLIIDSHLDLAWNAVGWDRDLNLSVAEMNAAEKDHTDHISRAKGTVTLPELRRGGIAVSVATVLYHERPAAGIPNAHLRLSLDSTTPAVTYAQGRAQLEYYRALEDVGTLRQISTATALDKHWSEWEQGDDAPLGYILSMEGADPILHPAQAERWWNDGLRVTSLIHYGKNQYAVGTGFEGPVSQRGFELLDEFSRLGMMLDVTHLSDESFFQALDHFSGPVLATHNNCRALVPGQRQFSDEQLRLLIERGAVIGSAFDSWMLYPGWRRGETDRGVVSIDAAADHVDHICQLAGNADHVALGTDLDGGFGTEQTPVGLDTIADLQKLDGIFAARGYDEGTINKVFHGNWLRYFREHLPA
jgi:membrane dipeptidase